MTAYLIVDGVAAVDGAALDWGPWLVPLQVLAVVLAAVVARWLLHRVIRTVVERAVDRHERRERDDRHRPGLPARAGALLAGATGVDRERYLQRTQTLGSVLRSLVTVVVSTLATLTVFAVLGVPLAPLLASAGVGGVALGFGAQSLVKDFLSGIFMIVEDQYGVGDLVDTGEVTGTVEEITLRVTRLRDGDGVVWYVRNGEIVRIANLTQGWATAIVTVPLGLDTDLSRATTVLSEALASLPEEDPRFLEPPKVTTESLSTGVLTLQVAARCSADHRVEVQRELRTRVKSTLDADGIAMAAPAFATAGRS